MIIPTLRKPDRYGQGHYLAKRGDRVHEGVDLHVEPYSPYFSDVTGTVTRWGYPYANDLNFRLMEIRVDAQTIIKYMYINPIVRPGHVVRVGQKLGVIQDLTEKYPGINNHVHFEVWIEGKHVDPLIWLKNKRGI
jgi:murein DD-endopeptidase MepM/ murein hydrolase activator NlpD